MELNLSEEDTNLLVSYISKDPDRFTLLKGTPRDTLSRNYKRYAFKKLAKLLRKLEEKTVLQLIDDDCHDFYSTLVTVADCKACFPANRNLRILYKYLLENMKFTSKVVNAQFEPLKRFAELKKQNKQKQKNLFIRYLSRSYRRIRNIRRSSELKQHKKQKQKNLLIRHMSRSYKRIRNIRKRLDVKFSLLN